MDLSKNLSILKKQKKQLEWVKGLLMQAQGRKWFGTITIEIKNGMIDLVRNEETLKPPIK